MTTPATLTIHEAAQLLRCHPATVRRMIARGDLQTIPTSGRMVRIVAASIPQQLTAAHLAGATVEATR